MQTLSSPKLRRLYEQRVNRYNKAMEEYNNSDDILMKKPDNPKGINGIEHPENLEYANEVQRLSSTRGTPRLQDFQILERKTGLDAGVTPIKEKENAIRALQSMSDLKKLTLREIGSLDPLSYMYTYPNGRQFDDILKASKELHLI